MKLSILKWFKFILTSIILFMCGFMGTPNVFAQAEPIIVEELVRWTPNGMVVFASDAALSEEMPVDGLVQSVIYRRVGDESSFREIGRLQRADSWEEFVERAGEDLVEWFRASPELETDEEVWEFIKQNPSIVDYGFDALDESFWRAFGTAYFDEETVDFREGETVSYQVRFITTDGSESDEMYQGSATVGELPNLLPPSNVERFETDSLAGGTWISPFEGGDDAFFGQVYRQDFPDGEFRLLPGVIPAQLTAVAEGDSVFVYRVRDQVEPDRGYRYYIEPLDMFGTPGPPSDTLMVISVDFNNLPSIGNVAAVDTTSGIHLSWNPLPNRPYITGVEISRSREPSGNFMVLDTLSVTASEFLDTRLVPNRTYYYEFRAVTIRESLDFPTGVASASFRNTEIPPTTPSALQAEQEGDGIRLHWDSVEEPDLFGYYVYRGTSRHDSMAVVSRAIRDTTTFLDRSEELDGRTNYVYAVRAVNMSDMESELSNMVVARPNRLVRPPAPIGIEGYAEQSRIRLSWRNEQRRDGAIAGYHLYRTTSQPGRYPEGESASVQAEQAGFERINDEILTTTSFDDINVNPGETYYYALSTEDHFGVESTLSEARRFRSSPASLLPPSQVSARTVTGGVEIRWNRTLQQDVENYRIYKRARGEENPSVIGTVSSETTRFTDDEVTEETLYWYSVSVVRGEQESSRGREQSVSVR